MSLHERAVINLVSQLALSYDGVVLGVVLACAAVRTVIKFAFPSSALRKLRNAPYIKVSDLRSILASEESQPSDASSSSYAAPSTATGIASNPAYLSLEEQRTVPSSFRELKRKNFIGFPFHFRSSVLKPWKEQESKDLRTVPFVLVEGNRRRVAEFVVVNVDESRHPLPLATVYLNFHPVTDSPYKNKFVDALFRHEYPGVVLVLPLIIGFLDEEKILPLGKEISAVDRCSFKNGVPEIKSCNDLPYFLSEMSKDQMVVELTSRTQVFFWSGIVLVSMSIGILGYAVASPTSIAKEFFVHVISFAGKQSSAPLDEAIGPDTSVEPSSFKRGINLADCTVIRLVRWTN